MCVLQDFEAITPNILARTIETVEGGGLVVLLLKTMTSLRQLYTLTMVRVIPLPRHSHLIYFAGCACQIQNLISRLGSCPI